ncbi:MAG: PilT protein domain protein [Enterovirga sp.]|nr:PilT protein domain protein [Enterovirga sp.]
MIALDTNVLVYAEGIGEGALQARAREVIEAALVEGAIVPAQVLAEMFRVLVGKAQLPVRAARERVARYQRSVLVVPTLDRTLEAALDLATEHRLQIFDAIILAASAEAGCRMLLTQDMQDGFVWRGMTVANPFAATLHSLLADLLRQ